MRAKLCLLLCATFALWMLATGYATEINLEGLNLEELYSLKDAVSDRILALEQANNPQIYDSGSYLVGRDIPAGDYVLVENEDAVFASIGVRAGITEDSELLSHHLINIQAIMRLNEGTWATLTEARAYPLSQAAISEDGSVGEGGYLVGVTLPAGNYVVNLQDKAPLSSYSVYDGVLGSGEQLIKFEVIREATEIELDEGEYIELSGCRLEQSNG